MKDFLKKLIASKKAELAKQTERMKSSTNIDEVRALGDTLIALRDEISTRKPNSPHSTRTVTTTAAKVRKQARIPTVAKVVPREKHLVAVSIPSRPMP